MESPTAYLLCIPVLFIVFVALLFTIENNRQYTILATFCIVAFIISALILFAFLTRPAAVPQGNDDNPSSTPNLVIIAFLTMIFSGIGTFSTLVLGWRNEIRNTAETKLKMEKLELEITELKSKMKNEENNLILIVKK